MLSRSASIIERLSAGHAVSDAELLTLLTCSDAACATALFAAADRCNTAAHGDRVEIRAIIEISNYCRCACAYCGMWCGNTDLPRYRLSPQQIAAVIDECAAAGYQTIILQSGEDPALTATMIGDLVRHAKKYAHLAVTLSLGERDAADYRYWRECGADRYLIKHETANQPLYNSYHPHSSWAKRLECLNTLSALGYELGSGFMVGLPQQTPEMLIADLRLLQKLQVSMAGIGPYICHAATALAGSADGDAQTTQKVLALARLLLPQANLPSTTALNVKGGLVCALHSGANVIMQKATPAEVRDYYDIYPGRESSYCNLAAQRQALINDLRQMNKQGI